MSDKRLLESSELYDKRYKNFATLIIFPVLILMIGIVVFTVFARKQLIITSIGEIQPINQTVELTTYIPSREISAVTLGQNMRLTIGQDLPKSETLSGKITYIADTPTTNQNVNYYKVQAVSAVKSNNNNTANLKNGLQGKVSIIIGDKTYFGYYRGKVMGKD